MPHAAALPSVIQGGMGVGVSNWRLARTVSSYGQLGVVSGTGLDTLFVRRLQDGDEGGHLRRAMPHFPMAGVAERVLKRYFRPGGRAEGEPYALLPLHRQVMTRRRGQLTALANFVEVYLAREGHDGAVGINLLTKIQLPNLASLYGAMLAGVDYVLMGAGIPREIPGALDRLSGHDPVEVTFDVTGVSRGEREVLRFEPGRIGDGRLPELKRPSFVPVVASDSLAKFLFRRANGAIQGFVVEGPTAGGHNAPPRCDRGLDGMGQPIYGERDVADLGKVADLGLPFWVAGGAGRPERLREVRAVGAAGVQVGTLFAYCRESGLPDVHKEGILNEVRRGVVPGVLTDGRASPTGFPFKTLRIEGTCSSEAVYGSRRRRCDLGYLRAPYRDEGGRIGYRCPAEPVSSFVAKGGSPGETGGRKCLCNALMANVGRGQVLDDGTVEPGLFTAGDDLAALNRLLDGRTSYSATDVVDFLLADGVRP